MVALIYLASPYSHTNPAVRTFRYEYTRVITTNLLRTGLAVFSPIVYGRSMEGIIGTDYLSWKLLNDAMLEVCTSMLVLKLDGWDISKGVRYEIEKATARKLPINYLPIPEGHI
jgi:hypothetical protein